MDESHNGWANFKTWLMYFWMTNEEPTYVAIREVVHLAKQVHEFSLGSISAALREFVDDQMVPQCLDGTWAAELLSSALDDVNMDEIAMSFLEDIEDGCGD